MFFSRVLRSKASLVAENVKPLSVKNRIHMAYDLHMPIKSVNPSLELVHPDPIVFVHGIFGSKRNYKNDCQKIANVTHMPVYTVDLRNHGLSEHALPFDYSTLAQDVVDFCEDHNLKKVNLIGYSLGAKICMLTALKNPDLVKSGVIIDNSPVVQPDLIVVLSQFLNSMLHVLNKAKIRADEKDWKREASQAMRKYIPNGGIRGYLLNNLINKVPEGYRSPNIDYDDGYLHFLNPINNMAEIAVKNVADWPTAEVEGKTFNGPIHFLKGKKSDFISKAGIEAIKKYFPNYSMTELNTTHFMLNERPNEYVKVVCDFFKNTRYRALQEHLRNISPGDISESEQQDFSDEIFKLGIQPKDNAEAAEKDPEAANIDLSAEAPKAAPAVETRA